MVNGSVMGKKQQTLVLLSPGFARDEMDTTCIPVLQYFVKNLKIQYPGLHIIILAFQYPFSAGTYAFHGAQVISFNGRNRRKIFHCFIWIKVWLTLSRLKRQYQVLGLLSFWFTECAFIGSLFARCYRLKHFSWLLGQDAKAGNKYFSLLQPRAENLIVLSDSMAGEVFKNYSLRPRHIIPFGVDASIFPAQTKARHIDIMGAGSLIPLKRYGLFLEVIARLTEKFPDLRVVLCGQGPEKASLLDRIEKGKLQKHITLLDEVPHAQVLALMQQSRIFLHTSGYEGFAAVCAEALYAGAHVVSFCQPIQQPIRHWHIAHSEEELLGHLAHLLSDKALRHEKVLPFTMQGACAEVMKLFGYYGIYDGR
jgi:glycosyltransferase involved in cell wall biosynthesis